MMGLNFSATCEPGRTMGGAMLNRRLPKPRDRGWGLIYVRARYQAMFSTLPFLLRK